MNTKVREGAGGGGAPGAKAEIPLQPLEDHTGADVHTAISGQPHARTHEYLLKDFSPWRAHSGGEEKCEEEGVAERRCYGLTASSHSPSPSGV